MSDNRVVPVTGATGRQGGASARALREFGAVLVGGDLEIRCRWTRPCGV